MIQVICCKCGKELGWKAGGNGVSHGLCNPCLAGYQEELAGLKAKKTRECLDTVITEAA